MPILYVLIIFKNVADNNKTLLFSYRLNMPILHILIIFQNFAENNKTFFFYIIF